MDVGPSLDLAEELLLVVFILIPSTSRRARPTNRRLLRLDRILYRTNVEDLVDRVELFCICGSHRSLGRGLDLLDSLSLRALLTLRQVHVVQLRLAVRDRPTARTTAAHARSHLPALVVQIGGGLRWGIGGSADALRLRLGVTLHLITKRPMVRRTLRQTLLGLGIHGSCADG